MIKIDNVFFVDTPYGGSYSQIPDKNDFGVRIRIQMSADDEWGRNQMAKMIKQLKEGRVKVIDMMDSQGRDPQIGDRAWVDVGLVFSR